MLNVGDSKVIKLYAGNTEYRKAYLGDVLVFNGRRLITVTVTGSSLSSLLSAGELNVAGVRITKASTEIEMDSDEIEVSFTLVKEIGIARSVAINGADIGHVKGVGESVSTTLSVRNGTEIEIVFTTYVEPYSITVAVDPDGSGEVTGGGQYEEG